MKRKNFVITVLAILEIVTLSILFVVLNNKTEKEDVVVDLQTEVDSDSIDSSELLNYQIDSLKLELKKCYKQKSASDSLKRVFISENETIIKDFAKKESSLEKKVKKLEKKVDTLKEQNSLLKGRVNSLKELVSTYNSLETKKGVKSREDADEPLIRLEPEPYFKDYIEIITDKVVISKAVIKDKYGKVVEEYENPIMLSTNRIPSGVYYVSFYNESGELIEKARVMAKK